MTDDQPTGPTKRRPVHPEVPWYEEDGVAAMNIVEMQALAGIDESLSKERVKEWIALFEYQGFNPRNIISAMTKCCPDRKQLYSDVNWMIVIAMTRGTVIPKIKRALSVAGSAALDILINRYRLVSTGKLGDDRKTAITLARVCACFPAKCVQVMLAGEIMHPDQVPGYPSYLCFPAAATMIPRHATELREMYKIWSRKFAERTAKKGQPANNDIAINLLEVGDDKYRCQIWNIAQFLISQQLLEEQTYSNGSAFFKPLVAPSSYRAAAALVA